MPKWSLVVYDKKCKEARKVSYPEAGDPLLASREARTLAPNKPIGLYTPNVTINSRRKDGVVCVERRRVMET